MVKTLKNYMEKPTNPLEQVLSDGGEKKQQNQAQSGRLPSSTDWNEWRVKRTSNKTCSREFVFWMMKAVYTFLWSSLQRATMAQLDASRFLPFLATCRSVPGQDGEPLVPIHKNFPKVINKVFFWIKRLQPYQTQHLHTNLTIFTPLLIQFKN